MGKKINITKENLERLYIVNEMTTYQISKQFDCCQATVWKRLKNFKIKARLSGSKRVTLSKRDLEKLYLEEKKSTWKIEAETGYPRSTIHRKLKEFNIITRDLAEANTVYPKKDFSGDITEKAYIIGFRIGDLRVRKQYKNSRTVCVGCGSTKDAQIQLIREMFSKYGRVWVKKTKNNKINCEAFLNDSFKFLLNKKAPDWVFSNKSSFFSFLGGFSDAEGCFAIHNNMAYYSLGNYDSKLLFKIYKKLNSYGIYCNKPYSDKRKGKINNEGYKYNNNYWQIRVSRKDVLKKFFFEIRPYIKHSDKMKALNKSNSNIISRSYLKNEKQKFTN